MRTVRQERIVTFFAITLGIIVLLFLVLMFKVENYNRIPVKLEIHNGENMDPQDAQMTISMEMTQSWEDRIYQQDSNSESGGRLVGVVGAEFDGTICNQTDDNIHNWSMIIHLPVKGKIDSSWNGEYEFINETDIVFHPDENLETIPAHGEKTFGFVIMTDKTIEISDFSFEGYVQKDIHNYLLYWFLWIAIIAWIAALVVYVFMLLQIQSLDDRRKRDEEIISQTMMTFAGLIDAKDSYTKGHSVRVAQYSKALAKRMGMKEEQLRNLGYIALMHDCGKMGIPDLVLKKPDHLSDSERKVIESHTTMGGKVLENFNTIEGIQDGARYHHERYDGKGYPEGLVGENIPIFARIICVADAFDAMNSDRCYRKHLSKDTILEELEKNKGLQFDPVIAQHMIDMIVDGTIKVMEDFH